MKRDMELVRNILLKIENNTIKNTNDLLDEHAIKEDREILVYHLSMLIDQAGLVKGIPAHSFANKDWLDITLTWEGHDFLSNIQDSNVWSKVLKKLSSVGGSASLDVVKEIAKKIVVESL